MSTDATARDAPFDVTSASQGRPRSAGRNAAVVLADELKEDEFTVDAPPMKRSPSLGGAKARDRFQAVVSAVASPSDRRPSEVDPAALATPQGDGSSRRGSANRDGIVASGLGLARLHPSLGGRRQSVKSPVSEAHTDLDDALLEQLLQFVRGHVMHHKLRMLSILGRNISDAQLARAHDEVIGAFKTNSDDERLLPSADHAAAGALTPRRAGSFATERPTTPSIRAAIDTYQNPSLQRYAEEVGSYFQYAFEEVALNAAEHGKAPFSHKDYHQALERSVASGIESKVLNTRLNAQVARLEAELVTEKAKLARHASDHQARLELFLSENNILRERLAEAQRALENAHGPHGMMRPPVLLAGPAEGAQDHALDAQDKKQEALHGEALLAQIQDERQLLRHALLQRDAAIAELRAGLLKEAERANALRSELDQTLADQVEFDARVARDLAQRDADKHEGSAALERLRSQFDFQMTALEEQLAQAQQQLQERPPMEGSASPAETARPDEPSPTDSPRVDPSAPVSGLASPAPLPGWATPGTSRSGARRSLAASERGDDEDHVSAVSSVGPAASRATPRDRPASGMSRVGGAASVSNAASRRSSRRVSVSSAVHLRPSSAKMPADALRREVDAMRQVVAQLEGEREDLLVQMAALQQQLDESNAQVEQRRREAEQAAAAAKKRLATVEFEQQRALAALRQEHEAETKKVKVAAEKRVQAAAEAAKALLKKQLDRAEQEKQQPHLAVPSATPPDGSLNVPREQTAGNSRRSSARFEMDSFAGSGDSHPLAADIAAMNHQAQILENFIATLLPADQRAELRRRLTTTPLDLPDHLRTPRTARRLLDAGFSLLGTPQADPIVPPSSVVLQLYKTNASASLALLMGAGSHAPGEHTAHQQQMRLEDARAAERELADENAELKRHLADVVAERDRLAADVSRISTAPGG
jgi:hypothetical protein